MLKTKFLIFIAIVMSIFLIGIGSVFIYQSVEIATKNNKFTKLKFTKLELANTYEKREKGLMSRKNMCDNCGMLFEFSDYKSRSFWMKDTLIPLDIIFINKTGQITNICKNMAPLDISTSCQSNQPVQYVLETNPKYLESRGIDIDSFIDIENLKTQAQNYDWNF